MSCPLYGFYASTRTNLLVPTGGNQCPLVLDKFAPCALELAGRPPDLRACDRAPLYAELIHAMRENWQVDAGDRGTCTFATYEHLHNKYSP